MTKSATAAEWQLTPSIALTETYYDNITLSQHAPNSEVVSEVTPSLSVSGKGRRLQLNSQYSLAYFNYWKGSSSNRFSHQGNLSADWEAIKKHLFVNASASISQQVIDPTSTSALGSQAIVDNKTETRTVSVNPILKNRFGRYADSLLSYEFSQASHDARQIEASHQSTLSYTLSSGRWFNQLTWLGDAQIQQSQQDNADGYHLNGRIDYRLMKQWAFFSTMQMSRSGYINTQVSNSRYFMTSDAGIVWTPSRKISMELGGGGEVNVDKLFNENQLTFERPTWRAKINLKPTSRTSLELGREQAAYGRRLYSTLTHYTRKTTWSSTYGETLTTPNQLRNSVGNNANALGSAGQNSIPGFSELNRGISDDVILRKRFDANLSVTRRKVNLSANAFYEKGEYQTSNQTDKRYGGGGGIEVTLSRKLSGAGNSSVQRYYFNDQNRIDNIYFIDASLTRQLGKKANASLIYEWQKRSASNDGANYILNKLIAQVSVSF